LTIHQGTRSLMKIAASIVTEGDVAGQVFGEVSGTARNAEAPIDPEGEAAPNARRRGTGEDPKGARRRISEQKEMLKSKRQELRKIRDFRGVGRCGGSRAR
jgi:hypothetical protein